MHIYIHLTAEGYQRSFPAIWGWHWYRSYLKPMEHRPEPQIVTWDPSFCRGFGLFPPLACGGARIRCTQVYFLLLSIALAVNFTFTWEHQTRARAHVGLPGGFGAEDIWGVRSRSWHQGTLCYLPCDAQRIRSFWTAYKLILSMCD